MSLNVGQLVATLDADDSGMIRGLTAAELAMAGFERDATGRLRRVNGEYVSTGTAARELGASALQGASRAQLATANLQRDSAGRLRDLRGRFVAAGAAGERLGHQLLLGANTGSQAMRRIERDANRSLGARGLSFLGRQAARAMQGLRGTLGGVASGLAGVAAKLAPLVAGLGSAVPLVAGLVGTLTQIAPAAAVAATGIFMVVTASATMKLAMHGVGAAVKAAFDPGTSAADLKKALDGLAPSARAFVLQLRSMRPELHSMQQAVQQRFFSGLAADLKDLGRSALPVVRSQLVAAAAAFNIMGHGVIQTATALADSGTLGTALKGATKGLTNLSGIPAQIVNALGQVAAAAAPTFTRLTASAGSAAQRVSDKINKAFESGAMQKAIDLAVGVLKELGGVLKNIGSIVGSVFGAANAAGGSWLGVLKDITGAMATAFASPAVQSALGALFKTMRTLGSTVGPLVAQALGAIGPVLTALGPAAQTLITALGAGLKPAIAGLKPVLAEAARAVAALVIGLSPLLPIVGDLIAQLLPVLMPVLKSLTVLFGQLAGPIRLLGQALGQALTPIISALGDSVSKIVGDYMPIFLSLIKQGTALIPALAPVLVQLGQSLGQVLAAVLPLMPQIQLLSIHLVMRLLPAILPLIPPLANLTILLLRLATVVITGVVVPALRGLVAFLGGMQAMFAPGLAAVAWLVKGIAAPFEWLFDHLVGHSVIPDMVRAIVMWLGRLPVLGVAAVAALPARLAGLAASAASRMVSALASGVRSSASAVGRLPAMARSALGNLGGYLYNSGRSLISGFAAGIRSMASSVASAASSVLSKAKGFFPNSPAKEGPFSGSGWTYHSGVATARDWAAGLAGSHGMVSSAAGALMGTAQSGLGLGVGPAGAGGSMARGSAASGSNAGGGVQRVVLDVTGGDQQLVKLIRSWVRTSGRGDVQLAFGR